MKSKITVFGTLLLILVTVSAFMLQSESKTHDLTVTIITENKVKGIALEAPSRPFEANVYDQLIDINADWVCLIPYAFTPKGSTEVRHNESSHQWWGERKEGIIACAEMAEEKDLKVMIKPHLWLDWGSFTGDLSFENDEDWYAWESDYHDYIMEYVEIAQEYEVELFCIGTELKEFIIQRPHFWEDLICEIRDNYDGKLTYAGNWDSYKYFEHWDKLDYIGVDAYFPLSEKKDPEKSDLIKGWQKWKKEVKSYHEEYDLPVLFTEFGYCSTDYACSEPWSQDKNREVNNDLQALAYDALFETFWNEDWFHGGFIWKWHTPDHLSSKSEKRFTPQNKEAVKTLKKWYGKDS